MVVGNPDARRQYRQYDPEPGNSPGQLRVGQNSASSYEPSERPADGAARPLDKATQSRSLCVASVSSLLLPLPRPYLRDPHIRAHTRTHDHAAPCLEAAGDAHARRRSESCPGHHHSQAMAQTQTHGRGVHTTGLVLGCCGAAIPTGGHGGCTPTGHGDGRVREAHAAVRPRRRQRRRRANL